MKKFLLGWDKLWHFLSGILFMLLFGWLTGQWIWGATISLIILVGKEIKDYFGPGNCDFWDVFCDFVGITVGYLIGMHFHLFV